MAVYTHGNPLAAVRLARTVRGMPENKTPVTRDPATTTRRAPGPHATQPRVGQVMARVAACVTAAHQFLIDHAPSGDPVPVPMLSDAVVAVLGKTERLDERTATISALCDVVVSEITSQAARSESELTALVGGPRRRSNGRITPWLSRALLGVDIHVDETDLGALVVIDHPAAILAAQVLAAHDTLTEVRCGALASVLAATWDATSGEISINDAVLALDAAGLSGEAVCWAAISREGQRHVLLVLKEANRAARSWSDRSADSLIGYAWQGLRLALRNYDPSRGMFSTYACPRIRGTIRDGVRSEHHLPKRLTTFVRKVANTREQLRNEMGRHPTLPEVAGALDMDLDRLTPLTRMSTPLSYNEISENPALPTPSALCDLGDPADDAVNMLRTEAIHDALEHLDPEDAEAVRLLVLESVSVAQAQVRTATSARQLRQRRDRGLAELATLLADWAPAAA